MVIQQAVQQLQTQVCSTTGTSSEVVASLLRAATGRA
jgi:hypothetical protein